MLHGYAASLLQGAGLTLSVALASLVVAVLLGTAGAAAKLSRQPVVRLAAMGYTTLIRGVPDLVMMMLVFYGGQIGVNALAERFGAGPLDIDPFVAGIVTIGFVFGAYLTEIFRGAFLAVPNGQREAAQAYGMSGAQTLAHVIGPQMLRHALPPLSNCWLVMLKSTAIVSLIGLHDLMHRAADASGSTHEPFLFYGAAALMYLGFTCLSELLFAWMGRRLSLGVRKAGA